jgi:hypothetical protein
MTVQWTGDNEQQQQQQQQHADLHSEQQPSPVRPAPRARTSPAGAAQALLQVSPITQPPMRFVNQPLPPTR